MLALQAPTSTLIKFGPVPLNEITEDDIKEIRRAIEAGPIGQIEFEGEKVKQDLLDGQSVLWRLESEEGNVVFLLQETVDKDETSLVVSHMAGKGLKIHGDYANETITEYARLRGCRYIRAQTIPVVAKYLKRHGYESILIYIRKEI